MIRLSKSIVGQSEADAVTRVIIEDGYLGMGAEVEKFETEIANYIGVGKENVVCVNSGTAALHLAVAAVTNKDDEVLVPSLTFVSSFQAISASGAIPIACEVYEDTLSINLEDAESKITEKTKAIMAVHYASNPVDIARLYDLANKYKLRVIEDAAHAFGCIYENRKIGSFGDIICFSFDGIKNITSGEGGAIITTDTKILEIVKDTRLLGIEKDSEKRYKGDRSWDFDVSVQGYRYHMSNIFAAIGRVQLQRLEKEFIPKRMILLAEYRKNLEGNAYVRFINYNSAAKIVPHILPVLVLNNQRDELKKYLEANNIQTGIHYKPNHLLTLYKYNSDSFEVTNKIYEQLLTLPLHPDIDLRDVKLICSTIDNFFKR
jgi:dTDP-4-amino-4,6-dideoxygalactose transaminase